MSVPEIWAEKHRPKTLDEYVWRDPQMREKVEQWISQGGTPHLLLSGIAGTGKTSLAYLILKLLDIPNEDLLKINASRERKVEDLQDKIISFINTWAFGPTGLKYVVLDEADRLTPTAQSLLRNEMETYSNSTRFIFTCNYEKKIIPALHSRFQEIKFLTLDAGDFITRIADVLDKEGVRYDEEVLVDYYEKTYPDLRKCIGLLQQNTNDGALSPIREEDGATKDYLIQAIVLFQDGRFLEARKLIIEQAQPDEYEEMYRFLYQNLSFFGSTQEHQDEALLVIRKAIVFDGQVADREINAAACLCELSMIGKG